MCKITAPEPEPQRGTVIQTDDSGRIATMPVGTPDRPVSRIISRDEYDRLNTPQGRSAGEARAEIGFGREQDLARQAMQIDPRDITADRQTGMPSAASIQQILRGREDAQRGMPSVASAQQILRGREESQRGLPTLRMGQDDITAMAMSQPNIPSVPILKPNMNIPMPVQKPDRGSSAASLDFTDRPDYKRFEPDSSGVPEFDQDNEGDDPNDIRQKFGEDDITAMAMKAVEDMEASQKQNVNRNVGGFFDRFGLSTRFRRPDMPEFTGGFDKKKMFEAFKNFFRARYNRMGFGEELGETQRPFLNQNATQFANGGIVGLRRGGNGFTTNLKAKERDDAFIESQYDNMPVKYTGDQFDTSNVDEMRGIQQAKEQQRQERMQNLQSGFESAFNVNVPNDPFKAMQERINDSQYQDFLKSQDSMFAGAVNRLGKFMGYDDPFELYKATQAQLERNKVADAMRRKDQDRAMTSQAQKPFDPCPPGYKYDPVEMKCVPEQEEQEDAVLGQEFVRNPEAFTGDPNMYGRVGGEYQFFTEVPGLIKAANGIPRGPTGEIRGVGGPKDDLVGPFMLSDQEYVLPKEMVMAAGGGNYDTGIKKLENMRKDSLNKYGDYV